MNTPNVGFYSKKISKCACVYVSACVYVHLYTYTWMLSVSNTDCLCLFNFWSEKMKLKEKCLWVRPNVQISNNSDFSLRLIKKIHSVKSVYFVIFKRFGKKFSRIFRLLENLLSKFFKKYSFLCWVFDIIDQK